MTSTSSPSDPLHGLNPEELLELVAEGLGERDTVPLVRSDLPSLEEVARAFPDLEVEALIGRGGMSAVFRARQPRLNRVVALKVLPKSLAALPGFAERFTREGQVLARLTHPHIVTVHDFGERGGFWFLIMEHVDGVNLRQAMRAVVSVGMSRGSRERVSRYSQITRLSTMQRPSARTSAGTLPSGLAA